MNNVAMLETNIATFLGVDGQLRDVGHECHDVSRFFSYWKLEIIPPLGLLILSRLFLLHNNYP